MVKRHNGIEDDDEGAFVYYDDYATLEAQLAAAEARVWELEAKLADSERMRGHANARLARLDPEVDRLRDQVHELSEAGPDWQIIKQSTERTAAQAREIKALKADREKYKKMSATQVDYVIAIAERLGFHVGASDAMNVLMEALASDAARGEGEE